MTIERLDGRVQICCDHCPASFPPAEEGEFRPMVGRAVFAGWTVRKRDPAKIRSPDTDTADLFGKPPTVAGARKPEPWEHICPACVAARAKGDLL